MITIPHLETDVTTACQLSCVGCNHSVPLYRAAGPPVVSTPDEVARDLSHLATLLHTPAWGALGGEPLLHHALVPVLEAARASRVADRIEVWTNGLLLPRQPPAFWRAFDTLVLSVYEGKHTPDSLAWIAAKCRDEGVTLVVKDERQMHNFRTLFEPTPTDEVATARKFTGCFFRSFSRVANHGWFYTCCCAPHLPRLVQGRPEGSDGVRIEGLTAAGLREYLERREPLGACRICAGRDTARPLTWREERDPTLWRRASGMEDA